MRRDIRAPGLPNSARIGQSARLWRARANARARYDVVAATTAAHSSSSSEDFVRGKEEDNFCPDALSRHSTLVE